MENGKINRSLIAVVVAVVLIIIVSVVLFRAIKQEKTISSELDVQIKQIYSSDYLLSAIDSNYYIGSYEESKISVIIDNTGKEVYKGLSDIVYDSIYMMKDGRYLIYSNADNKLTTYVFDGTTLEKYYEIENVSYVNPIIYTNGTIEYIIGFASLVEDDLYLYSLNNGGIVVVNDVSLVADNNDNGRYYTYNENYLVVKNKDNYYGVIDLNGLLVIDYKYKNIINTYNDSFVALNKKGKYGIINRNNETLVKFSYSVIDFYENYYLLVNTKNKMALYDLEYNNLTGFEMNYNSLIEYDLRSTFNSINLYKVAGKVVVVNNYMEDKNGTEYDKHNLYIINNGEIVENIKQVGFDNEDVIYTYDKDYNVVVFDNQFVEKFNFKLDNVKKINSITYVSSSIIRVDYLNVNDKINTSYYDDKGNIVEFELGDVAFRTSDYFAYYIKNDNQVKLAIYNTDLVLLDEIVGTEITWYGDYLIVDNSIYKIEVIRTNT